MARGAFTPPPPAPLGLGGIMSTALAAFRAAPLPLMGIALVSTLPVALLATAGDISYGAPGDGTEQALRALVQLIPVLLLSPISTAATTVVVIDMLHGMPASASRGLEPVGERFWVLAGVLVLTTVGIVAGLLALVIPGVVLLVLWLFAAQVCIVERRGVRASIRRSADLVRGGFWWTLGSFLVISITVGLAAALLAIVLGGAAAPLSGDPAIAVSGIASLIASTVVQPVANVGVALIYLERRMRHGEGRPAPTGALRR